MYSRALSGRRPARRCEIGPFVVEYVFREQSLVVELEQPDLRDAVRAQARAALLRELGFRVLLISQRRVRVNPQSVLRDIKAALDG